MFARESLIMYMQVIRRQTADRKLLDTQLLVLHALVQRC